MKRSRWGLPEGGSPGFLWASVVQEAHARSIRRAIDADTRFQSLSHLCAARGLSYKRINDMLLGATVLRIETIGAIAYHLGPASLPTPAEIDRALNWAATDIGVARPPHP